MRNSLEDKVWPRDDFDDKLFHHLKIFHSITRDTEITPLSTTLTASSLSLARTDPVDSPTVSTPPVSLPVVSPTVSTSKVWNFEQYPHRRITQS